MKTRSPAWVTAAAVTVLSLQLTLFVALLPRPVEASDRAAPQSLVRPAAVAVAPVAATVAPVTTVAPAATARSADKLAARSTDPLIQRGEYVARIGACHDCHTDGYAEAAGDIPAERLLTGSSVGFRGGWGVSYPANLRLSMQKLSEEQWLVLARAPRLPPMPWFNLRDMSDEDLRALYRYVRWLGPAGEQAPLPLAAGAQVSTPYYEFEPRNLPATAKH